jgi:hypothetical protein
MFEVASFPLTPALSLGERENRRQPNAISLRPTTGDGSASGRFLTDFHWELVSAV